MSNVSLLQRLLVLMAILSWPAAAMALEVRPLVGQWTDALTLATLPDGSLLVAQQSGLIDRLYWEGTGFRPPVVWADLGDEGRSELVGLAVDPDFLSSGYLYAALRTTVGDKTVLRLTRWRDADGLVVLSKVLVDRLPSGPVRAGGVLKFGPDGHLWLGVGDGGAVESEVGPGEGRGALLRYAEDGSIPEDNPIPGSAAWAWGLRDPSGLAWQPDSGRLYLLDRGPAIPRGTMDELNLIEKGGHYGWPKYLARENAKGITKPVIYSSSGHSWVPGGAVFVNQGVWKGSLLFAGAGEGTLYRLSLDAKSAGKILFYEELLTGDLGALVDVAVGSDNELYLLSREKLYRLAP